MKMRLTIVLCLLLYPLILYAQTNRALFVAIGEYPEESGWSKIHATHDVDLILPILKRNGYSDKNIKVLLNSYATKARILAAFDELRRQSSIGDCIYVHFSCHGQQMVDDNGDESDGLDEALVPYDAKRRYVAGEYEGENHLRDDDLEWLLNSVREKVGANGQVTVVLDACHSGTGTRDGDDDEFIRGTAYIFAPENYRPSIATGHILKTGLAKSERMAPLSVFSACCDHEKNYEYYDEEKKQYYGSLSYALSAMLEECPASYTWAQLSDAVKNRIQTMFVRKRWTQTPFFESTNENDTLRFWK